VSISWPEFYGNCKSRISAIARTCFQGRQRWKEKYFQEVERLQGEICELEKQGKARQSTIEQLQSERDVAYQRVSLLEQQLTESQSACVRLPDDQPAPGQQYGASLMALSINLGRDVGLRKSVRAMKTFFKWLGVKQKVPSYQAVRTWMQRLGLSRMRKAAKKSDWIWIVDQSNQIGLDKCLTILAIERSKLPPAGTPLTHKDMTMLGIYPARNWNRKNVQKIYHRLSKRYGTPVAILSDGAVELREPVESLKNKGLKPRSIRDMKHFLANRLEAMLTADEQFQAFTKEINQVRSSIQQTELSHLIPPSMRQKSRFMNLEPTLKWASMALWQLEHPDSDGRKGISTDRLETKLGWLRKYKQEVGQWNELQNVVSLTLQWINAQGLSHGTAEALKAELRNLPQTGVTVAFIAQVLKFIREHECKLEPGERLPMSTEILESSFALFKALEQYHARSGFTQLLLAFPCLLKPTTAKEILRAFAKTKIKDTKHWIDKHLPKTHDARVQAAYREYRKDHKANTQKRATTLLNTT
jgi:hypothetical protein